MIDQYGGRVFDDYDQASSYARAIGYPELMRWAEASLASLPDGFIAAGFCSQTVAGWRSTWPPAARSSAC